MFGKDQRGYVLSGLGLLLLIPVMIVIPIFLAVEAQSSNIPESMITSDTTYRTYQDIKTDVRNQVFAFGDKIQNGTYHSTESGNISSDIITLHSDTLETKYQSVFNNLNITITPNYPKQSLSDWNYAGGTAYLNNGIIISCNNVTSPYLADNNLYSCNYTMAVQSNMNISVDLVNRYNGHNQNYAETYNYYFTVDSGQSTPDSAITSLNSFFKNISDSIKNCGIIYG